MKRKPYIAKRFSIKELAAYADLPVEKVELAILGNHLTVEKDGVNTLIVNNPLCKDFIRLKGELGKLKRWSGRRGTEAFRRNGLLACRSSDASGHYYIIYPPIGKNKWNNGIYDTVPIKTIHHEDSEIARLLAEEYCLSDSTYANQETKSHKGVAVGVTLTSWDIKECLLYLPMSKKMSILRRKLTKALEMSLNKKQITNY